MTNLQMWSLIAGFFMPPVLAIIQQSHWSQTLRAICTFAASLLVGAGTAYFSSTLTGKTWVQASLVVLVATIATYHGTWKPAGIAPVIEAGTNIKKPVKTTGNP
jgi:hypothetical protein